MNWNIHIKTLSDASFGRGDGVSGLVDAEVQHDEWGLPYLSGRTLKGLLAEECANLLYALQHHKKRRELETAAAFLFGCEGKSPGSHAYLSIDDARLPEALCAAVRNDIEAGRLTREDVLDSLTSLRRQTAIEATSGAPARGSLRTLRVVLRNSFFIAPLHFDTDPKASLPLLNACAKALRRAGTGRNRGRGRLEAELRRGESPLPELWSQFKNAYLESR